MSLTNELLPSKRTRWSEKADSRSEFVASKRQIVPSKIIDLEEFRIERAIDLKVRRAGHLGCTLEKTERV